jgi:CreA protein
MKGMLGAAAEVSDMSLACRRIGPIAFEERFEQGEEGFGRRRSLVCQVVQIVRACDARRNVLVCMVDSE